MEGDLMQIIANSRCDGTGVGYWGKSIKEKAKCVTGTDILRKIIKTIAIMWFWACRRHHYLAYRYRLSKTVNKLKRTDTRKSGNRIDGEYK